MLKNWLDFAVKADDMHIICVLHAHMAHLFMHTPLEEHTRESITMLLASQIVLNSRHTFNVSIPLEFLEPEQKAEQKKGQQEPPRKKKKKKKLIEQKGMCFLCTPLRCSSYPPFVGLLISDVEIFDLFQRQRRNILLWLERDPAERSAAMEEVVRLVTLTRETQNAPVPTNLQARYWRSLDGMNCVGRYIPDVTPRSAEEQAQVS